MRIKLEIKGNMGAGFKDFGRAAPIATRKTLNIAAGLSRRNAVGLVKRNFTERNTHTRRNIQFRRAGGNKIENMRSSVGATTAASYMGIHEIGGIRKKKGRATAIPQEGARIGLSDKRPVRKPRYISRIETRRVKGPYRRNYKSRRARFVAKMAVAYKRKKYFQRGPNMFEVSSFSAGGGKVDAKLKYLYKAQRQSINISKRSWLAPAVEKPARDLPFIWRGQVLRLFKARTEL